MALPTRLLRACSIIGQVAGVAASLTPGRGTSTKSFPLRVGPPGQQLRLSLSVHAHHAVLAPHGGPSGCREGRQADGEWSRRLHAPVCGQSIKHTAIRPRSLCHHRSRPSDNLHDSQILGVLSYAFLHLQNKATSCLIHVPVSCTALSARSRTFERAGRANQSRKASAQRRTLGTSCGKPSASTTATPGAVELPTLCRLFHRATSASQHSITSGSI